MEEKKPEERRSFLATSFHKIGKNGTPYDILDDAIEQYIIDNIPLFVMNKKVYIYKKGVYVFDEFGDITRLHIKSLILPELVQFSRIERVYKLLLSDHRIKKELSEVNVYPSHWINFKNGMYDLKENVMHKHSPSFLSLNQIPHDYIEEKGNIFSQSIYNEFIGGVIPDEEDRTTLFEYIGYCMTKETNQQKLLVLTGPGGTGKSTVIRMIEYAIGKNNISNVSMQELNQKFYPTNLMGKLMNSCADISKKAIEQTDVIKKITGEDYIQGEYKGGAVFFFKTYAKLLFSANEIPISLDDKSNAFYRRFLIIRIDKRAEHIENLEQELQFNIEILISEAVKAARELFKRGYIFESTNSKANVLELYKDSDNVMGFLEECCEVGAGKKENRGTLRAEYEKWCTQNEIEPLSPKGFYKNLRTKGYKDGKTHGERYLKGVCLKNGCFVEASQEELPFK